VPDAPPPLPAGFRLVLDHAVRRPRPEVLVGGSPVRLVRLRPAGAAVLDRWLDGAPVGSGAGSQALARRLLDAGVLHPRPPAVLGPVTVVIPVRDRARGLAATLQSLRGDQAIIVVDDGSTAPVAASRAAVVRHPSPRGPAAARNTGWRAARTELVAFVDADCEPLPGWLALLLPHFADAAVGAAAPRIVSRGSDYERQRSPLDLGPREALVRPGSVVAYVPTAALVVRRQALEEVGGFDEALRFGEDVDLVWRLARLGWRVRYEPAGRVVHPSRAHLRSWLAQRYQYGRSTGPLGVRHGRAVAPIGISPYSAAAWALALSGHAGPAAALVAASTAAVAARAGSDRATAGVLAQLALRGHLGAGWALAEAVRRAWLPLVALGAGPGPVAAALTIPPLLEWAGGRAGEMGPWRWLLARGADDLAYQAGVWAGAIERRTAAPLLPSWWPAATDPAGTPPDGRPAWPGASRPPRPPGPR
jgi:mycofactocin system glycosyltransferase